MSTDRTALVPALTRVQPGALEPASKDQSRRASAAVGALSDNTRANYESQWNAWCRWALQRDISERPANPTDVADYLLHRHESGASPATIRMARSAITKAHRVSGFANPCEDSVVKDTLLRIGREGRDRGRGQVAGIGWAQAEAIALLAVRDGSASGLRDAAIIRLMSDGLLRISEVAALQVSDLRPAPEGGATITIRASKSDQQGEGMVRYLGRPTVELVRRWQKQAGITEGPLFRALRGRNAGRQLRASSVRDIVIRRAGTIEIDGRIGGHSLRVGSAQALAADGASIAELQQAGGWKAPSTPGLYVRNELAARGPVARRRYKVGTR